ncbi:MAG: DUF3048 domain-containing protein [Lachnospiraceae bacterium]
MKKKFAAMMILALTVGMMAVGCGKEKEPEPDVVDLTFPPVVAEEEEPEAEPEVTDVTHEGEAQSMLTGEWLPEEETKNRPFAIMLGNTTDALPQYGIGKADVLYECLVEGGLTRLMGIFDNYNDAPKYGSVRSCRLYYAYIAKEYDAIYAHYGQASNAKSFLNSDAIDNLNGLEGAMDSIMFYRSGDRPAPHNVFTTPEGITAGIEKKGYRTTYADDYTGHFLFSDGKDPVVLDGKDAYAMQTSYPNSKTWFEYDAESGMYKRFHYKKEHVDGETGEQLTFTNVIFQFIPGRVIDDKGRMEFDTVGSGKGIYFTGGKCEDITWKKDSLESPSLFYDNNGDQLVMNPGKTSICIITTDSADNIGIYESADAWNDR